MFNTLKYAKILEEVGFSRDQAETSIKILVEIMEDKLATKQDLQEHRAATERDFQEFRAATQHDIAQVKSDLTIRMGSMLAASIVIMTTIQAWLIHR
jgi:hypothetical protein